MRIFAREKEIKKKMMIKGHGPGSLAKKLGKDVAYMSRIHNGLVSISAKLAHAIAEELDCEFEEIFIIKDKVK